MREKSNLFRLNFFNRDIPAQAFSNLDNENGGASTENVSDVWIPWNLHHSNKRSTVLAADIIIYIKKYL